MEKHYYNDIANLISDYNRNEKKIDNQYVFSLIDIILENDDLYDYLKESNIYGNNSLPKELYKYFMLYNPILKMVSINTVCLKQEYIVPSYIKTRYQQKMYYYFYFNRKIIHELEHTNQEKTRNSSKMDLESTLIKLSNKDIQCAIEGLKDSSLSFLPLNEKFKIIIKRLKSKYFQCIYQIYYEMDLRERLANIYSYQANAEIANILGLTEISAYEKLQEYELYTSTKSNIIPTIKYLSKICTTKEMHDLKEKITNLNLSLEERLKLGLEISPLEYEQVLQKKQDLERQLKLF